MAIQLDFWSQQEIERLEKRIAAMQAELVTLREENEMLSKKRHSKRTLIQLAKMLM